MIVCGKFYNVNLTEWSAIWSDHTCDFKILEAQAKNIMIFLILATNYLIAKIQDFS